MQFNGIGRLARLGMQRWVTPAPAHPAKMEFYTYWAF